MGMTGRHEPEAMRREDEWSVKFFARVNVPADPSQCWTWTGTKSNQGYGMFSVFGYSHPAHRLAFLLSGGAFGSEVVMHTCDNPGCVNPLHLRAGTHQENSDDMVAKGRVVTHDVPHLRDRANHPRAKAAHTPRGVYPSASLAADDFGVTPRTVQRRCSAGADGWSWASPSTP